MPASSDLQLTIRSLTPDLWPDFEDLFGKKGACNASGTGYVSTFARAGFKIVARRDPPRPIMRHDLKRIAHANK